VVHSQFTDRCFSPFHTLCSQLANSSMGFKLALGNFYYHSGRLALVIGKMDAIAS
jgi:hypothetical protein